jgi:quercetin dioxygenase-like cupin family protein
MLVLRCVDFDAALAALTGPLGLRIDSIFPADAPAVALLSGSGVELRLERDGAAEVDGEWRRGRAGMWYRDLIPDRLGGEFIASHIRIPDGGPVPDYVHHHQVRFQMIFCRRGWVRVVYEDQGEPFIMEAGDCVLQPPGIRHRVLESSVGLEVIEIGAPALHETFADHDLALPTATLHPDREFGGQRFVRHVEAHAQWLADGPVERADTGIGAATGGVAAVCVVRSREGGATTLGDADVLRFVYVLAGAAAVGAEQLRADECRVIAPREPCVVELAPGAMLLEVLV